MFGHGQADDLRDVQARRAAQYAATVEQREQQQGGEPAPLPRYPPPPPPPPPGQQAQNSAVGQQAAQGNWNGENQWGRWNVPNQGPYPRRQWNLQYAEHWGQPGGAAGNLYQGQDASHYGHISPEVERLRKKLAAERKYNRLLKEQLKYWKCEAQAYKKMSKSSVLIPFQR